MQHKYEIEAAKANKLANTNSALNETNNNLETEVTRLKYEIKRIEKELQMEVDEKNNEIKRLRLKSEEAINIAPIKAPEIDSYKINTLKMDIEMLESQYQQAEADKNRYYNRTI